MHKGIKDVKDRDLLVQLKRDPESGFKLIFDIYWIKLFGVAVRKLGSEEDASDIVQDVFISFWLNIEDLNSNTSFSAYLMTSLRNKILNFYERNSVRLQYSLSVQKAKSNINDHSCPDTQLQAKELEDIYEKAILSLPQRMQAIYRMSRILHLSNSEIAEKLDISLQTVKNQLYTADSRVRAAISFYNQSVILFIQLGFLFS